MVRRSPSGTADALAFWSRQVAKHLEQGCRSPIDGCFGSGGCRLRFDSCMPQDDPHTHLKLTAYPLIRAGRRCRATNPRAEIRPTSICHRLCRRGCPTTLLHQPYTLRLNPLLHRLARPACPGTCHALLVPPLLCKAALAPHPCATTTSGENSRANAETKTSTGFALD